MKNESAKKSLEKSKNVLEEKRKMVKQKICIKKTNRFTIIAVNFVQEQFKNMTCQQVSVESKNRSKSQESNKMRNLAGVFFMIFKRKLNKMATYETIIANNNNLHKC